ARARDRRLVHLGRPGGGRADLSCRRDRFVCRCDRADHLRRLVLSENETASHYHMKAKILSILLLFIFSPVGQALACPFCYGAKDGKSTEHMGIAISTDFVSAAAVFGVMVH